MQMRYSREDAVNGNGELPRATCHAALILTNGLQSQKAGQVHQLFAVNEAAGYPAETQKRLQTTQSMQLVAWRNWPRAEKLP